MFGKVSIDREHCVVVIEIIKKLSSKELSQSLDTAIRIAKSQGINKILIDLTSLKINPSLIELHLFATILSERSRAFKHALVLAGISPNDIRHIENVTFNRGLKIQIFSLKDDALTWLNPEKLRIND